MVIKIRKSPDRNRLPARAQQSEAVAAVPPGQITRTRVTKKISRDTPPDIPFLEFIGVAGRGGMSTVWHAWHKELRRDVAVKVLDADFAANGKDVRQFMIEVRTMSNLHHQGIVQGYGADFADGSYYFIMDYVDGYTFGSFLNRKKHVSQSDALVICESVADAMKYAWDNFGIVHCDLKPENIMVDRDGTVKITDLGLCQCQAAMKKDDPCADEVVGTPAYISPEQIYGDVALDCRADIYSLGATLYHLTAGRTLFPLPDSDDILRAHVDGAQSAPDPRKFNAGLSQGFVNMLARMLVKDRDRRYRNWDDVFSDARAVEEGDGNAMPRPPEPDSATSVRSDGT
ncbi:MAG: serine/threonine protein kinase [Kiritimatiellia bacterium]